MQFGVEKISFTDLVGVKDMILKKCEYYSNFMSSVAAIKSEYGNLKLESPTDTNKANETTNNT